MGKSVFKGKGLTRKVCNPQEDWRERDKRGRNRKLPN